MAAQRGFTGPANDRRLYAVDDITSYRRGGIGVVFEGKLTADRFGAAADARVGLKMLTAIDRQRYDKLAERSAQLRTVVHPHLARHVECFIGPAPSVDEVDEDECDNFFSVHAWVDGAPLSEIVTHRTPVDVLRWAHQIADALDHMHTRPGGGFAHRDVHPRNVIISPDDSAVLIDFDTILWGDPDDTNIVSLSTSSGGIRRGLIGAQASDTQALAHLTFRCLAADPAGKLTMEDAEMAAVTRIRGVAKDPVGVVNVLQRAMEVPPVNAGRLILEVQTAFESRPTTFARVRRTRGSVRRVVALSLAGAVVVAAVAGLFWTLSEDGNGGLGSPNQGNSSGTVEIGDVTAADLPTVEQVAQIYGELANGAREDVPDRGARSAAGAEEASASNECGTWLRQVRAVTGLRATYYGRDGGIPEEAVMGAPKVGVYQFSSEANAKAAVTLFTADNKRCAGLHSIGDETSEKYTTQKAPAGFAAVLEEFREFELGEDDEQFIAARASLEIVSRKGPFLIHLVVDARGHVPDLAAAIKLAMAARHTVGESK